MTNESYQPPLNLLLAYGDCLNQSEWPNYLELGFGPQHIPDLIRMATDKELRWKDSESAEVWAPVHAWRTLGQLRAEAAIEPLLQLFRQVDEDDDWVSDEMPKVFGMIGPAATPALAAYLSDESHGLWARLKAASCLQQIVENHPDARDECVAILARQLEHFEQQDVTFNGTLISELEDLKAVEAAPVIERAFAAGRVDESIMGDWEDVQVELGLKEPDEEYRKRNPFFDLVPSLSSLEPSAFNAPQSFRPAQITSPKAKTKAKSKRKHVKASRKKNRRR